MIEKAYGVVHGASLENSWGHCRELFISPSDGLYKELESLQRGSVVGIEYHPRLEEEFDVGFTTYHTSKATAYYWNQIEKFCDGKGLEIVYLEDIKTYQKYIDEQVAIDDIERKNKFSGEYGGIPRYEYRHEVLRDYIHQVEREEKLFENISKMNPTVVILGRAHAEALIRKKDFLCGDLGIQIRNYKFEMPRKPDWRGLNEIISSDLFDYKGESVVSLDAELIKRRYLAVTTGEIISGGNPDYIGYWDIGVPERGLFEVYINSRNENSFSGIIEDVFGRAEMEDGTIDGRSLSFKKLYLKKESSSEAIQEEITYQGELIGDLFIGEYLCKNRRINGLFSVCSNERSKSNLKQSLIAGTSFKW